MVGGEHGVTMNDSHLKGESKYQDQGDDCSDDDELSTRFLRHIF
jgi:hypothetical protein